MRLRYAARSDVGLLREGNEDSLYASPRLLAVADGMGGHAAGEVASAAVIRTMADLDRAGHPGDDLAESLRRAVADANGAVRRLVAEDPRLDGMGTTLTALVWDGGRVGLLHVGDSRAYLLHEHELVQLTHDHTFVQRMVDEGRLSAEEAGMHPQRSVITRALDGRSDVEPDVEVRTAVPGDRYLLCSDGLSGVVSDETLRETLEQGSPEEAADALVDLALRGGGPDNVTVIVADVEADTEDNGEEQLTVIGGAAAGEPAAAEPDGTARREAGQHAAPRRRGHVGTLAGLAVLVLLLAGAGGTYAWASAQWFVGASKDTHGTEQVAIFHGVDGSVAGVHLSSVHHRYALPVASLPPYEQSRVRSGIGAASLPAARRIVSGLLSQVCTPTPAPSPAPSVGVPSVNVTLPAACASAP